MAVGIGDTPKDIEMVGGKDSRPIKSYNDVFAPENVKIAPISKVVLNTYVLVSYN